jgi:hypothetical protein
MKLEFSRHSFEKYSYVNFNEIRPVGSELYANRQTDMTKLVFAFRNFADAPKRLNGSLKMSVDDRRNICNTGNKLRLQNVQSLQIIFYSAYVSSILDNTPTTEFSFKVAFTVLYCIVFIYFMNKSARKYYSSPHTKISWIISLQPFLGEGGSVLNTVSVKNETKTESDSSRLT